MKDLDRYTTVEFMSTYMLHESCWSRQDLFNAFFSLYTSERVIFSQHITHIFKGASIGRLQFQMFWINYAKDSRVHSILIHVIRCICFQDILSVCGLWDLIFSNFDWNNFFFDTTVNGSSRIWCETKWLKAMIRQI